MKMIRFRASSGSDSGFTLVEIAVSVAILGLALTTLIGLHTRMLNTYFNERNRTRSAFMAQYVITLLEVAPEAPEVGTKDEALDDMLETLGYFDGEELDPVQEELSTWKIRQSVSSIDLPLLEDALRRVDIEISWGDTSDESFALVYFIDNTDLSAAASPFGGLEGSQSTTTTIQ